MIVHATAIARRLGGSWRCVLLSGPSGVGKSDLALRCLARGWRLVSDDYAEVFRSGGRIYATAPATLVDRIEIRGLGLAEAERLRVAEVALVAHCQADAPERLPLREVVRLCDLPMPCVRVRAVEESAADKIEWALTTRLLGDGDALVYLAASRPAPSGSAGVRSRE